MAVVVWGSFGVFVCSRVWRSEGFHKDPVHASREAGVIAGSHGLSDVTNFAVDHFSHVVAFRVARREYGMNGFDQSIGAHSIDVFFVNVSVVVV